MPNLGVRLDRSPNLLSLRDRDDQVVLATPRKLLTLSSSSHRQP
jgi:hypothetical protein